MTGTTPWSKVSAASQLNQSFYLNQIFTDQLANIDMMFNPDKTSKYKTDKEMALADIRDKQHQMSYHNCFHKLN